MLQKENTNTDPFQMSHFNFVQKSDPAPPLNLEESEEEKKILIRNYVLKYAPTETEVKLFTISTREFNHYMIKQKMKDSSFFNLKTDKVNLSYKFTKIEKSSMLIGWVLCISGSLLGSSLARIFMTLSLLIQLLHKFILFNADFGTTLTYFLTATSKLLEEGEDDESGGVNLQYYKYNQRLVDEAELN